MASDTAETKTDRPEDRAWASGAAGGIVAAVLTGLIIQFAFDPAVLTESIPAAVGLSGLPAGWVVLLLFGAVLGLVYAAAAALDPVAEYAGVPGTGVAVGLAFGLVLWVLAVVVTPIWLGVVGVENGYDATNIRAVLGYALFGVVVGLVYALSPNTGPGGPRAPRE